MTFTVFCRTFMTYCNPDSSTKTHISSRTKHAIFQRLFHSKFTYLPTQTMPSFKDPSTEYAHIISHKACLFNISYLQKIHSSSHPKYVFLHAFFHKGSHILSPKHAFFKGSSTENSHIFPHKPCLLSKTLPQKFHRSSHPTHVFLQDFFQ